MKHLNSNKCYSKKIYGLKKIDIIYFHFSGSMIIWCDYSFMLAINLPQPSFMGVGTGYVQNIGRVDQLCSRPQLTWDESLVELSCIFYIYHSKGWLWRYIKVKGKALFNGLPELFMEGSVDEREDLEQLKTPVGEFSLSKLKSTA